MTFAGLKNYEAIFNSEEFWISVKNTFYFAIVSQPITMIIGLSLALLLKDIKGGSIFRTVIFLPVITSSVGISMIWSWMYNPTYGIINNVFSKIGLPKVNWLGEPATALPSIMVVDIWMWAGYHMVLFLAGLQSIPPDLYDAAKVDGATGISITRHITLPLLKPIALFVIVMSTIGALQIFDLVWVLSGMEYAGGPAMSTLVMVLEMYKVCFRRLLFTEASAMAVVFFLIVLILCIIEFKLMKGGEYA
jgi:ABC-type sugar transport system permease subunit